MNIIKVLFCSVLLAFCTPMLFSAQNEKKYVIFLADLSDEAVTQEIAGIMNEHPGIKIAAALPGDAVKIEALKAMISEGRLEAAITLPEEPVLPLLYETNISSPLNIKFSWQEDIWGMIASAAQKFYQEYSLPCRGLYLRSGIFSEELIPKLYSMGLRWVNIDKIEGYEGSLYLKNDLLVLVNNNNEFDNADECFDYIKAGSEDVTCIFFTGRNSLTSRFLSEFALLLEKHEAGYPNGIEMATPSQIYSSSKDLAINAQNLTLRSDLKKWLSRPIVWYYLNEARKVIEEYRNSGNASMDALDKLKGEIYQLYRYELIDKLANNPSQKEENLFGAGLTNIYRLAGLALPEWINEPLANWPVINETSDFSIDYAEDYLEINNSYSISSDIHIKSFKVTAGKEDINYNVSLDTSPAGATSRIDIYMDLNNKYRAGSTDLLNETNAFLDPDDAWELAIRIENRSASLYRSGRDKPKLIRTFYMEDPNTLSIPRGILRGNPLKWGYQAVVLTKKKGSADWKIDDFLSPDDKARQKTLKKSVISLPAFRHLGQ